MTVCARRSRYDCLVTRSTIAFLATAALLLLAAPARAADPLPLASASPADRATIAPTPTGGIPWRIRIVGLPPEAQVAVTITPSAATGPDGATLDDSNRLDFIFLSADAANPSLYTARSDPGPNAWSADNGTYFWQVTATYTDGSGVFHTAASEIQRLTIGTPPPAGTTTPGTTGPGAARRTLAMSSLDATYYMRRLIRQRTKRTPAGLRLNCRRLTSASFRCRPAWRDRLNVYAATATFRHVRSGSRVVSTATVRGTRASRQCVRDRSLRSCRVAFRWQARIASRPPGTRVSRLSPSAA
jgi:hypothetical protein